MFEDKYRRAYDSIPVKELKAEQLRECANAGGGNTGLRNANRIWNGVRYVGAPVLSLCLVLVLVLPVMAEEVPAVYRMIRQYAPALAEFILQEEHVCTSKGITLELEAVNIAGNEAEVVVSFQDEEGGTENYIRGKVDLYDSYSISNYGECSVIGGCSFLEYDSEADKAYFKIDITSDKNFSRSKIKFAVAQLLTNCVEEERRISLDGLIDEPKEKVVEINGGSGKLGKNNGAPFSVKDSENYEFPNRMVRVMDEAVLNGDLTDSLQITGIAYDEGILRVQQCRGNFQHADRHIRLYMKSPNGSDKIPDGSVSWQEEIGGERVIFDESWFVISEEELEQYELYGTFYITDGSVQGDWEIVINLGKE